MTLLVIMLPAQLIAQNEATQGKWEKLYYNYDPNDPTRRVVVAWRKRVYTRPNNPCFPPNWFVHQVDQEVGPFLPSRELFVIHGVHAALLPVSGEEGDLRHGWVIMWGLGYKHARGPRVRASEVEPEFYPSGTECNPSFPTWIEKIATTPVLLWHPTNPGPPNYPAIPTNPYGYTRHLFDTDTWSSSGTWPIFNLFCSGHAFLPDGRLLVAGGHGSLWANPQWTPPPGQEQEPTVGYVGLRLVAKFDGSRFTRENLDFNQPLWSWGYYPPAGLHEPRWYPSLVALPDGKVLIVGGTRWGYWNRRPCTDNDPNTPGDDPLRRTQWHEIYDPCRDTVTRSPDIVPDDLGQNYPRLHLVSWWDAASRTVRSRVVYTGPAVKSYYLDASAPLSSWQPYSPERRVRRDAGTSVLLPNPVENPQNREQQVLHRVLTIGGENEMESQYLSFDLHDFGDGTLSIPYSRQSISHRPRYNLNAVLLPNGQVLIVGGQVGETSTPDIAVLQTLLYTPPVDWNSAGSWQEVASAPEDSEDTNCDGSSDTIPDGARIYHSTALLLPDGRVLAAGSQNPIYNYVPTIYSPPYLFKSDGTRRTDTDRPQIVGLSHTELNYGQNFEITYRLADDSHGIRAVVLMRPGSVTHAFNFEQRLVRLRFKLEDPTIQATAPWHPAIAPPGWYMLFLVDENGVPSKAAWVRLKHRCPVPLGPAQFFVELEGVDGPSAEQAEAIVNEPITLEFRNATTGATIETYTLPMDGAVGAGRYRLEVWSDLPAGMYEVYVHPYRSWLGQRALVNWQPGGTLLIPLRNGDVVKDNQVDYADLVLVLEMQGATGVSEADVNGDGVVNEADVAIVATNVGQQGDE